MNSYKTPRLPIRAAPEGGILKKCRGEERNGPATVLWHALGIYQTNFTVGLTFDLHALCGYRKPCKEAQREEVPHSTCEGCKSLLTGSADYLSPPPAPPSLPLPLRQLQERILIVL